MMAFPPFDGYGMYYPAHHHGVPVAASGGPAGYEAQPMPTPQANNAVSNPPILVHQSLCSLNLNVRSLAMRHCAWR